jgi:hypothetical protein
VTVGDWPRVLCGTASNRAFCVDFTKVRSPWVRPRRLSPRLGLVMTGILCWPSLSGGVGGGTLAGGGGEESGVYASGVLDCVSAGGSGGASSSRVRVVRSILRRAVAVYSARVRGLWTVMCSVSTMFSHVDTSASKGCRWCVLCKRVLNCVSSGSGVV